MKKRMIIRTMAAGIISVCALTACNNAQEPDTQPANTSSAAKGGMKIAYIETDSIMTQYTFCTEYAAVLQKKSDNAKKTLTQKGQKLQDAINNFQKKLNNNEYTSREQAESVQTALARQQEDLQTLNDRLSAELANETIKYNEALHDSLQHFLNDYNKTKKYDFILAKSGDNILLANGAYNITDEVIKGLNKRYKPAENKDASGGDTKLK